MAKGVDDRRVELCSDLSNTVIELRDGGWICEYNSICKPTLPLMLN